ncbi:transcription initiation factor TFIID subunit, putative [Phytophthora infestans T30-4]|uniref:Transcription initiation factor TFIID subunit 2 n=1 Tax=Phytophthora infestans (strain T30-4) TaxID=403677 RepID=D0NZN3_PHYIT|nr:transcription initiation factor TFIID subunit, putative [Phytophthora infestans T30-4]EEY69598.1 transcription initiation factor TFIID subunit, putative [Phytophthora infestans T30-4]|eukprot:XP_002997159.1 transcription initiation factor TFIID subunit, putative [Phytophthora infestans T30-4]
MIGDFEYLQQRVALRVDVMRRHVAEVAEVVLAPRAAELRVLRLHARQLKVKSVRINDVEANFEQLNFLDEIVDENYRDLATFDLFYRGAITEVGTHKEQKLVLDAWDVDRLPKSSTGFKPVLVRVEYELDEPTGGLRFVLPDEQYQPKRSPHMYTYCGPFGGLCDGARSWMPCRDTLRDACTFRIELTVPDWCVAVCSGQMVQQLLNPETDADGGQWRTFRYVVNPQTNCSSIGFAVGPFRLFVPPEMPRMTHFALPECFEDLVHCTSKLASTMSYFEGTLGASYPFKTYQQVFVEDLPDQLQYVAGGAILDQNLLHGPRTIDRELPSHLAQVKALVGSWIGGAVGIQSTKDAWVLIGVIGHLVNTYVRSIYGEEEYGYRIQLAMDALTTMELTTDQQSPALLSSEVDVYSEYDPLSLTLLDVKAPLVVHMIEQRVGPKHLGIAIQRAVSGGAGAAATTATEPLTTLSFLKTVKTIAGAAGQDLTKSFLTSWIIEPGMPFFTVGYWYNRKQTQAEVALQQEIPPGGKLYTGPITITIVEDTSEYTYQKRIEHKRHKFDFPCHSKVRKKRRRRQGLADPDDSVSVGGPGMGLNDTPVFWVKIDTGCAWLRHVVMHQPDFNWMEQLLSDKKVGSRVHAARALALFHRPHEKPNVMSCRVLTECMSGLTTHSRRLRAEAAQSLGIWQSIHAPLTNANTQLPIWKAMHNLVRIFKEHFFDRATDMPLPNYFLPSGGKVILEALGAQQASISSKQIQSPAEIETFLLQLLTENDNSKNYVEMDDQSQVADDCYYLGNIVLSLSVLTLDRPARSDDGDAVVLEILRYLHYDQVQPSYNKTITVCCLEALCNLVLAGRCDEKLVHFHVFASPKHSNLVRKAAIESILRLYFAEDPNGPTTSLLTNSYGATAAMLWLCELLKAEQSPGIRLFAVQVCLNCMRGFPPSVGKEVLATWDHSYTLGLMNYIEMKEPTAFVLKSPEKDKVLGLFDRPNLSKLRDDSSSAKRIAENLWNLMNATAAMDQRLRVALIVLYRKFWGETTPIAVAHIVQDKPANWAGGYESLRLMMEESKNRMLMNGGRAGTNTDANGLGRKSDDDRKRGFSSTASSPADAALEQFRGKKFKFKMGDTTFRSHKL